MKVNFQQTKKDTEPTFDEEDKKFSHGNQFDDIADTPSSRGDKQAMVDNLESQMDSMNVN